MEIKRELSEEKIIWNWAEEEGIVDEFSYDTFLKALKAENQKRKELDEKGEPVYGPVEFTPMQYYKRLIGECEQELKNRKMEEISEEELVSFYESHQENYRQVDSFTADYTVWQEGRITYQETLELNDSNVRAMTEADEELANKLLQLGGREDRQLGTVTAEKQSSSFARNGSRVDICLMKRFPEQC